MVLRRSALRIDIVIGAADAAMTMPSEREGAYLAVRHLSLALPHYSRTNKDYVKYVRDE